VSITSLAEVKDYLNFDPADTSNDTELQRFIDAADPVVEDIVGPVNQATFDEWYDGGYSDIVLRHWPVISITAVTEYAGTTPTTLTVAATPDVVTGTSYVFDPATSILYRVGTYGSQTFAQGTGNIRVQYTAGRTTIPGNIKLAALELIRHLYQSTQQGGRPTYGGAAEEGPWAPAGFAVPTRVIELLEPYRQERLIP
jgi:hypothetical protein